MNTSNKNLKSPKQLFEEKRLNALIELERQETNHVDELLSKKILPPKYFFNDKVIEEFVAENEKEDLIEQVVFEEIRVDHYQEQLDEIKNKISQIEEIIPEEVDLTEVTNLITSLERKIDLLPEPTDYSGDIEEINNEIKRIENSIPILEIFDPSDLYQNIFVLKNKIEEVRSEIPTIPQPILYDDQLDELRAIVETVRESIPTVPEVKYYDDDLQSIIDSIDQVRQEIPELPEIRYYDEQISEIENRLLEIQESIPTVPEVKYYDDDVKDLRNEIQEVINSIPTVPEVKYYDEDLKNIDRKLEEKVEDINILIDIIQESIPTVPEVKYYDEDVKELQNKIEEVRSSIPTVPEVKYYDEDLKSLNEEIKELYNKISSIKVPDESVYFEKVKTLYSSFEDKNHKLLEKINYLEEVFEKFNEEKILKEDLAEPPQVKNSDPLTPLDQNYVTLDQLQQHYKLFINRVQQQLATIGGGGETQLKYLDDIVGIATNPSAYDGKFLKYNHSIGKFEFVTVSGGGGTGESYWVQSGVGIVTTSNVGVNTDNPTSTLTVNGDALVVGVVTATDFNSASDIKLKDNVSVIDNPLDKVNQLEGVNFYWKENGKKSLGVIAQEVEKVLPELVSGDESKTVNYNGLVGLLIECVKEQQKEINELKKLINK